MTNRKRTLLSFVCALTMLPQGSFGAMAQDKGQEKSGQSADRSVVIEKRVQTITVQTGDGPNATFGVRMPEGFNGVWVNSGGQQGGDNIFQFFSQEMSFDNRLVKGAPFSAETISETIQTLPDGNRIVQRSEGHVYRDSQGRTRSERTFRVGGSNVERQTIAIFDPVNGVNYTLDPETRTAGKMTTFVRVAQPVPAADPAAANLPASGEAPKKIMVSGGVLQGSAIRKVQPPYPPIAKAARAAGPVQIQVVISEAGGVIEAEVVSGHPLLRDAALQAARQWQFKPVELTGKPVKVQGILTFNFTLVDKDGAAPPFDPARQMTKFSTNTEQLGKQMVEGVECEGTRSVTTIPAGAIGNERPIETVRESWYSPELRMMVMTKQTDPRFGESTYRVTNISRSEPDASLFEVPSEYTIKEVAPPPPPPPPPLPVQKKRINEK